ncbi:Cupredoxin [Cryomyces antarcticus]
MKTISWSLALCLTSVIPTLAAPGWNDNSNNNNRGSSRGGESWGRISNGAPKNYGPHGGYKQSSAAASSASPSVSAVASAQKSKDGTCGGVNGYTCKDSWFGNCCSGSGYCGKSEAYCAQGCQSDFGSCDVNTAGQSVSTDGSCGGSVTCQGSNSSAARSTSSAAGSSSSSVSAGPTAPVSSSTGSATSSTASVGSSSSASVSSGSTSASSSSSSPVVSPVTGSTSRSASASSSCIPCEGQPGNDPNSYCGYDINTNYYQHVPKTCRTVEYTLTVSNTTIAPDGVERIALLINGQMPGPLIEANWGDTVVVHLINALQHNGTSFHFHGVRQNYTSEMDGVPSITQCPLAPGQKMTYTWVASQYGTSWYHSHYAIQASEGVFGPMIIHGPHAAPYDKEAGMIVLQDWHHQTTSSMYDAAQDGKVGGPRVLDNGLINGMNTWGLDGAANQTGKRFTMDFDHGKSYLLRLVNTAIQSTFKFYIDGHNFTVISTDFVPIKPYVTNILNINIGQRYNIIVHADQPIGDYWMRADNQNACARITQALDIKGIVHYNGGPMSTPTSSGYNYTGACVDEPYASIVPIVPLNAMAANKEIDETVVIATNAQNLYRWYLDGTTFQSQFDDPTLYGILKNGSVPNYSGDLAIEVPELGEWVYIVIESPIPLPHPIHLHGHDFFILGEGRGTYNAASSPALNLVNPPRRDVALLPAAGYLVLAFVTDNPGVWLMHCHIGWHTSMGFALQIIENLANIRSTIDDTCMVTEVCDAWNKYAGLDSTSGIGNENSTINGTTSNSNGGTSSRQIMFDSGV